MCQIWPGFRGCCRLAGSDESQAGFLSATLTRLTIVTV